MGVMFEFCIPTLKNSDIQCTCLVGNQLSQVLHARGYNTILVSRTSIDHYDEGFSPSTTSTTTPPPPPQEGRTLADYPCEKTGIRNMISVKSTAVVQFLLQDNYESTLCMVEILEVLKQSPEKVHYLGVIPDHQMNTIPGILQKETLRTYRANYNVKGSIIYIPGIKDSDYNATDAEENQTASTENYSSVASELVTFIAEVLEEDENQEIYTFGGNLSEYMDIVQRLKHAVKSLPAQIHNTYYRGRNEHPMMLCNNLHVTRQQCVELLRGGGGIASKDTALVPNGKHDYIFASYFTSKADPQRKTMELRDDFRYIANWYLSLKSHNMKAIIFHDRLSSTFISQVQQDYPNIQFHHCKLGARTTNDARFMLYLKYLQQHPEIQRLICTDISDVVFQENPFDLMTLLGSYLYIGQDLEEAEFLYDNAWVRGVVRFCYGLNTSKDFDTVKYYQYLYNAGMIGGDRHIMLEFLQLVTDVLHKTPSSKNCNMPVVNYVAHMYFDDITFTGFPFNNLFKHGRKNFIGVYNAHK